MVALVKHKNADDNGEHSNPLEYSDHLTRIGEFESGHQGEHSDIVEE